LIGRREQTEGRKGNKNKAGRKVMRETGKIEIEINR
jgi:hypothetical protein